VIRERVPGSIIVPATTRTGFGIDFGPATRIPPVVASTEAAFSRGRFVTAMRVLLHEFITSGALASQVLPDSLLREGLAMRDAIAADLLAAGVRELVVTCDARVPGVAGATNVTVHDSDHERRVFADLCSACDATLVIAPELGGTLLDRVTTSERLGRRSLNCHSDAIALCSDKLALARRLIAAGCATIPTFTPAEALKGPGIPWPCIVKPRYGAGSQQISLCRTRQELLEALAGFRSEAVHDGAIVQPYIVGRALSVAGLWGADGAPPGRLFPVAEQRLSTDGHCAYEGGMIPAADVDAAGIEVLVGTCVQHVPGLRGYVGFDFIVPDDSPSQPLLVEINPRLTTSYVGYRQLAVDNLARHWLDDDATDVPWRSGIIQFTPNGSCRHTQPQERSNAVADRTP
jgi:predicted ATP-grasp superfamily ATP-dependent carboligase